MHVVEARMHAVAMALLAGIAERVRPGILLKRRGCAGDRLGMGNLHAAVSPECEWKREHG